MSRLNVKIEPQFVQSVMRVAMDAVYHDGLESFTAGAAVVSNVDGLKSWITGLIDAVSAGITLSYCSTENCLPYFALCTHLP